MKNSNKPEIFNELDEQEKFQKDPSSYNGANRENYSWTQSIKDIDIRVKVRFFNFLEIFHKIFFLQDKSKYQNKQKPKSNHRKAAN